MIQPAISIVVPMYNLELYVERCLQSLAKQTLKDVEVLVVDDGSTDDTRLLISDFVRQNKDRFKTFTKPNGGHGSACNFGIERATGKYVMIVDGDDVLDHDTCEFMFDKAETHEADMLMGNLKYIFAAHTDKHVPIELGVDNEKLLDDQDRSRLFQAWATPCARIYRRDLFNDESLRFLPRIIFADVNFAPKSYLMAERIFYVNRELYNYDVTRPTQSLKQTDKRVLNVIPALRDALDFYRAKFAFRAYEQELMFYTVRHCVSWLERLRVLHGYPRQQAVRELFAVLDDYFGGAWLGDPLEQIAGRSKAALIRQSRRFGYAPIVWGWTLEQKAGPIDKKFEALLSAPLNRYRQAKKKMKKSVFRRVSI